MRARGVDLPDSPTDRPESYQLLIGRLDELYGEYARKRASSKPHDDSEVMQEVREILEIERILQHNGVERILTEVRWAYPHELIESVKSRWEKVSATYSKLQRLALLGENNDEEFSRAARLLEKYGCSFALLLSDAEMSGIIVGNSGDLHQQIRQRVLQHLDEGKNLPHRPAVSGKIIQIAGQFFFAADNPKMIWATHLDVKRDGTKYQVQTSVYSSDLESLGNAHITGPQWNALQPLSTHHMHELQQNSGTKMR